MQEIPEIIKGRNPNQRLWTVIIFALIISMIEITAQTFIKCSSDDGTIQKTRVMCILFGITLYSVIVGVLYRSYEYENMGHMNMVWSCMSIILAFIIGCLYFNEPFNNFTIIAIFFAICAIYAAHLADERG